LIGMSQGLHAGLIAERTIQTTGGTFTVRGLGLDAIIGLFQRRGTELSALYGRLVTQGEDGPRLSLDQAEAVGEAILIEAPAIAAELIAMAAGPVTDETVAIARALTFPVQLAAIEAVAELTFTSDMPPKKVLEIVVRHLSGLASAAVGLKA
jgi:hypothetical protein